MLLGKCDDRLNNANLVFKIATFGFSPKKSLPPF